MSASLASKTVFTADVVTYDFLPEKYAEEKALITAELNVLINCDWQDAINHVCIGGHLGGGVSAPTDSSTYNLSPNAQFELQQAQHQPWVQSIDETGSSNTDTNKKVGARAQVDINMTNSEATSAVQQFVHSIASRCGNAKNLSYYSGDATSENTLTGKAVNAQVKDVLTALLSQTITNLDETNTLSIDQAKVDQDLLLAGNTGISPWTGVPSENGSTTKLSELLSGFAFVPVLNRLVAGGGFTSGTIDGTPGSSVRFEKDSTSDGTTDLIHNDAHLVFPVRIMFADDGVTNQETPEGSPGKYSVQDGLFYKKSTGSASVLNVHGTDVYTDDLDDTFTSDSADPDVGTDPYVKVNNDSYVLQSDADFLVKQKWHSVKDNGLVAFQLNIIFSNKSAPDAIGSMA